MPEELSIENTMKHVFMSFYGLPGSGKTILASRIAQLYGTTAILTDESGHRILKEYPEMVATTRVFAFKKLEDFKILLKERRAGKYDFDSLIVDTFNGMVGTVIREFMSPTLPNGQSNPKYFDAKRFHPEVPVLQDYLLATNVWQPILQMLAAQDDFNVFLNCHLRTPDPEKAKPGEITRPDLPNGVWKLVNGYANVVGCITAGAPDKEGNIPRRILTKTTDKFSAKSQIENLPYVVSLDTFVDRVAEWRSTL